MKTNRDVSGVYLMLIFAAIVVLASGFIASYSTDHAATTALTLVLIVLSVLVGQIMADLGYEDFAAAMRAPFAIFRKAGKPGKKGEVRDAE